jgi:hypothetical protein
MAAMSATPIFITAEVSDEDLGSPAYLKPKTGA